MVTDSNELLGQALGTCTLRRLLGRGGMGAVYLAQQSRPRRTVAVKVLLPSLTLEQRPRHEFLARFRREADAIAALDHVNIMPIYEYGEQGDIAYLVMPYVTGGTLRDVLEARHILPLEETIPIIEQAAAALDTAHAASIVHRDLKPGNILFHADGRVLLADFGLAKVLKDVTDQEGSNGHLTSIGTIVGTPEYLSPEQGTGDAVDYRTDVYSLGVVLYQMLAGRVPFTGPSPVAVAIKHALEQPPLPSTFNPDIPPKVEAVIMKAMAKKPYQRYDSAGEFATALRQAAIDELGEQFQRVDPTPRIDHHATPALPQLESTNERRQPTTTSPELPLLGEDEAERPTTIAKNMPVEGEQEARPGTNAMSTILMPGETEPPTSQPENAAKAVRSTKDRIPALPTVITGPNDMETIADYGQGQHPAGQPLHLNAEQPRRATGPQQQLGVTPPIPRIPVYPHPPERHSGPRILPIVTVCLAVLLVVVGSITLATTWNRLHSTSTITLTGTGTAQAQSTKTAGGANAVTTSGKPYTLPTAMANTSALLYGTNYPANCDGKKDWKLQGVQATCQSGIVQLTGTGSNASAFTPAVVNGSQNYYVQLQITSQSASTFTLYFYNTFSSVVVHLDDGTFDLYVGSVSIITGTPLGIQHPQPNVLTIGFLVNQGNFTPYVDGKEASGSAKFADYNIPSGNTSVGVGVDNGQSIYIKNFAVYSAKGN